MAKIILENVVCKHHVTTPNGFHGQTVHFIVFYDPRTNTSWCWKTSSYPYDYKQGVTYSITGKDEGEYNLSHVDLISFDRSTPGETMVKSEQPAAVNALDILLPVMNLTNDEKYDIIRTKGGNHNGFFTHSRANPSQVSHW